MHTAAVHEMAAVKAGCIAAVGVRAAVEGVVATLKTTGRGKHVTLREYDASCRKKRQAQTDAEF